MGKKATAIVAYLFGIIGFLISYLAGDKEGAKFDLNQALVIAIAQVICTVIANIPYVGIIGSIGSLVLFVLAIMGIVNAAKDIEKELPIIGGIKILS